MHSLVRSAIRPVICAAVLLALGGCGPAADDAGEALDMNVLMISIDAIRADHVGAYGYDGGTTPFLDGYAGQSVVFENAYAPSSFTPQSVAAMLTGRLPTSGGAVSLDAQPHENAATLARMFSATGLHTGIFSNQFLLRSRGFTRGFEGIGIANLDIGKPEQTAGEVTSNALRFVDDYSPDPFFLFLHYVQPHQPYAPPPETASRFGVDDSDVSVAGVTAAIGAGESPRRDDPRVTQLMHRYDAEIAAVDEAIEALIEGLGQRGIADRTIVIVAGSQGQEFLDHGYLGHGWTVFNEALRVPLLVHAPQLFAPQHVAGTVSTIDIYPTLVQLFGLDPGEWQPDGRSFVTDARAIRVPQEAKFAELVIRERCVARAVMLNEWKYIAEYVPCAVPDRYEIQTSYDDRVRAIAGGTAKAPPMWGAIATESLFNLNDDPGETRDLSQQNAEQLAYMRGLLEEYQRYCEQFALKAIEAVVPQTIDPALRERLRGLGYQ